MVLFLYISSVTNNILYSVVDESEQYAATAFESSTVLCFFYNKTMYMPYTGRLIEMFLSKSF